MEEFGSLLPETLDFKIGYICGKQSTKYWLMCQKDLENMNESLSNSKGSVLLWCDARDQQQYEGKRQKKAEKEPPSKRQQIEDELEEIYQELKTKHGNEYSIPQLRCWARLIMTGKHQRKDNIPEFLVNQPKKPKQMSLAEAISGAVKTFSDAVKSPATTTLLVIENNNSNTSSSSTSTAFPKTANSVGISSSKISDLRMKKLQELRELQALLEQNVLTQQEFTEQKQLVLDSLRKLTH